VHYPGRTTWLFRKGPPKKAVDGISFTVPRGKTVGVVGESGSGKSTTGKAIIKLAPLTSGQLLYDGQDIGALSNAAFKPWRKKIQMIFQDPYNSLNPRADILGILSEPLEIHFPGLSKADREARCAELLTSVQLSPDFLRRYPHEFSGGQRQRIGIARALAVQPELIICDEPVSALDVSVQAQIINLLEDLQEEHGLAYLFVAHDLSVVHHTADRVAVMYLGRIVEEGPVDAIFDDPRHPYTRALLASIPGEADRQPAGVRAERAAGELRTDRAAGEGCAFRDRCAHRMERCETTPPFVVLGDGRASRCWLATPDGTTAATGGPSA
jgi:ABC-type dipeptide/oligopeptide/nickel transport system ATPase component